jgi:hypothetical protein
MVGFAALAKSPAAAIVAQAAGPRLPSYVTREQARAMINAAETTTHRLHEPGDQLDEDAVDALLEYAEWLAAEEDDPLSEEEFVRVREGEAAIAAGDFAMLEQVRRQIRLLRGEDDADGQPQP